jgi:hypothetical protein
MRAIRSRKTLYDPHTPHIGTDSGSSPPAPLDTPDLTIRFRWPGEGPAGECDNFFLGIWHPCRTIRVELTHGPSPRHAYRRGPNWWLASALSPLHPVGTGLLHVTPDKVFAVGFRGYILPRLHSYSSSADILEYWTRHPFAEHNGVFSAAIIGRDGQSVTLITDVLGIGPLYYRYLGDAIVFSTNPRYLTTDDDGPDLLAWRSLVQTSWIVGDRALCHRVKRLPAGHALSLSREGKKLVRWFDFEKLPAGTRTVGPTAVREVEESLDRAVSRCLQLQTGGVVLPLSSGFDSRRMLAVMMKRKVDFQAITCRTDQKSHRDLDARFALEMARDFGFAHRIVGAASYEQFVSDDLVRRVLVDAETRDHSWAVRVMKVLPERPSLFFDGIAGDILGDPVGWSVHVGLEVSADQSADAEVDAIATHSIRGTFDSLLRQELWPSVEELRKEVKDYVGSFLPRHNLSELAFLLLRQRRAISPWSQQLLPPGHVVACPYLDLDYLRLLLDFSSVGKHATKFQRACLREFWPELYKYPGNRDIPDDLPPGSPELEDNRALSCYASVRDEIRARDSMGQLRELLTAKGRLALRASDVNRTIQLRTLWYLHPLMELVSRQADTRSCWRWRAE